MKVVQLRDIVKKDAEIHYRRHYTALAEIDIPSGLANRRLEFVLEHQPLGHIDVTITSLEAVDYPMVPIQRALKAHITDLEERGKLP